MNQCAGSQWECYWAPTIGKILWFLAVTCLILYWIGIYKNFAIAKANLAGLPIPYPTAAVFSIAPVDWLFNAIALGILSLGQRRHPHKCEGGKFGSQNSRLTRL